MKLLCRGEFLTLDVAVELLPWLLVASKKSDFRVAELIVASSAVRAISFYQGIDAGL